MQLEGGLPAPTSHLGDRSPKSLVTLGDVVLIDTGDDMFIRDDLHISLQADDQGQPNRTCHYFFDRFVRWRFDLDYAGW